MEDKKIENERFVYQEKDIVFTNCQCNICKHNNSDNTKICCYFPNGKPDEVLETKIQCEYLDIK